MNGKMHPDDLSTELINPFVHRLEFASTYDKIKVSAALRNAFGMVPSSPSLHNATYSPLARSRVMQCPLLYAVLGHRVHWNMF